MLAKPTPNSLEKSRGQEKRTGEQCAICPASLQHHCGQNLSLDIFMQLSWSVHKNDLEAESYAWIWCSIPERIKYPAKDKLLQPYIPLLVICVLFLVRLERGGGVQSMGWVSFKSPKVWYLFSNRWTKDILVFRRSVQLISYTIMIRRRKKVLYSLLTQFYVILFIFTTLWSKQNWYYGSEHADVNWRSETEFLAQVHIAISRAGSQVFWL